MSSVPNKRSHEDTSIAIPLDIEEALKRAMDAGPYPEAKKTTPKKALRTGAALDAAVRRRVRASGSSGPALECST